MKLSEAIRKGIPLVPQTTCYSGCALGAAYIAKTGKNLLVVMSGPAYIGDICYGYEQVAKEFGIPKEITLQVMEFFDEKSKYNLANLNGEYRNACADFAEKLGY